MFSKVFLIFALACAASAYQIPYQGLEVPEVYEKTQYGTYHPFQELIKSVVGYPYYQEYYKYPYYNTEGEKDYVTPEIGYYGSYPYYGHYQYPYVNSWLKYPYYSKYYQQTYSPVSSYYYQGQNVPYYGYPFSYGSYPFWSKMMSGYYGYGSKFYTY